MREHCGDVLPEYIRELSLEDYFSERVTGSYAIKTIQNAWKTSRASFEVSTRNNELRYNAGATWEADRILKELPETLEAHKSRDWVVMNLDEAKEFFGVDFKTSFMSRLLKGKYYLIANKPLIVWILPVSSGIVCPCQRRWRHAKYHRGTVLRQPLVRRIGTSSKVVHTRTYCSC